MSCTIQVIDGRSYSVCPVAKDGSYDKDEAWGKAREINDKSEFVVGLDWKVLSLYIGLKERETLYGFRIGIANVPDDLELIGGEIGIYNAETDVSGFQIGIVNYVRNNLNGMQMGLIVNLVNETVNGSQLSLIYNGSNDLRGLQLSGVMNDNDNTVMGAQISYITSQSGDDVYGAQIGLITTVAGMNVYGLQVSLLFNKCLWNVYGLELGMINYKFPFFFVGLPLIFRDAPEEDYYTDSPP